jgi:hypothetical protein
VDSLRLSPFAGSGLVEYPPANAPHQVGLMPANMMMLAQLHPGCRLHHDPLRKEIRNQHGEPRGTAHCARFSCERVTCRWSPALIASRGTSGTLQDIVRAVRAKGASLKATEQPTDTSTAAGKCRHAGRVKGRPASTDAAQVRGMKAQGMGATDIAKALGIGRASVYRSL